MNFAAELLINATGMIFFIVIVAEIIWKLITLFRGKNHGSN